MTKPKYFLHYSELSKAERPNDWFDGLVLNVYSQLPSGRLAVEQVRTIDVSSWWGEGYSLYREHSFVGGLSRAISTVLWSGVGLDVRYRQQYVPFAPVPGKPGEFELHLLDKDSHKIESIQRVSFSAAGKDVTLSILDPNKPTPKGQWTLKLEEERVL